MAYPGHFTFIVKPSAKHPNTKDHQHNAAIASHIARTKHKWAAQQRDARLTARMQDVNKMLVPKMAIPRHPPKSSTNPLSPASLMSSPQDPEVDHYQSLPLTLLQGNSDPFSASSLPITPEVHQLLQFGSQYIVFWSWSVAMSSLYGARAHDAWILSLRHAITDAARLHVLLAGAALVRSDLFAQAHNPSEQQRARSTAITHKSHALHHIRQLLDLQSNNLVLAAYSDILAILQLVSVDFHEGNYEAALWHCTGARQLLLQFKADAPKSVHFVQTQKPKSKSRRRPRARPLYAVAEIWVVVSNLSKPIPCGMIDWHGERRFTPNLQAMASPPSTGNFFLFDEAWPALNTAIHKTLQPSFREMQKLSLYMERLHEMQASRQAESIEILEAVNYIDQHGTTLRAEMLERWIDFDSSRSMSTGAATVNDLVFSAQCLAALLFINLIFMYKPWHDGDRQSTFATHHKTHIGVTQLMDPSINHRVLERLQQDLQALSLPQPYQPAEDWNLSQEIQIPDFDLVFWISFIAAIANRLASLSNSDHASGNPTHPPNHITDVDIGRRMLNLALPTMHLHHWTDARRVLNGFLYLGGLMDWFLKEFFDGKGLVVN